MSDTLDPKEMFLSVVLTHDARLYAEERSQAGWTSSEFEEDQKTKRKFYGAVYDRLVEVALGDPEAPHQSSKSLAARQLIGHVIEGFELEISLDDFSDKRRTQYYMDGEDGCRGIVISSYGARDFGNPEFGTGYHRFAQPIPEIVDGLLAFYQANDCARSTVRRRITPEQKFIALDFV